MHSKTNTHGPGCVFMNTGHDTEGFPSAGAWTSYAMGSANENLPAYVAIPDIRGEPPNGKANWANGFLPARHQAIEMSDQQPIRNLARPSSIDLSEESASRDLLKRLNGRFAAEHPGRVGPASARCRLSTGRSNAAFGARSVGFVTRVVDHACYVRY